jgi:glutaredoxin
MGDTEIVMYVRPYCSDVIRAREALESRGVAWREVDIESDADANAMVRDWNNGRAPTPTLWIGKTMLVEPDADDIDQALASEGIISSKSG